MHFALYEQMAMTCYKNPMPRGHEIYYIAMK